MKTISTAFFLLLISVSICASQEQSNASDMGQQSSANATTTVAAILKNYNPNSLTQADAIAINNSFRQAGIRQGPQQKAAIQAAGFDPQKISSLDPPPNKQQMSEGLGSGPSNRLRPSAWMRPILMS